MAVSKTLKSKRKEKGWTQEELAKRSGVSQQAISFIESERNTPSEGTLRLLAKALDCTVGELLGEEMVEESDPVEQKLLHIFRQLNSAGQAAVLASAEALLSVPAMRQEGTMSSMA